MPTDRALLKHFMRRRQAIGASGARLNLALQGGGAHGAFTWGVLDALLEDPRLQFEGISGSSAGAMNAVMLASGWMQGGREGGRQTLKDFWNEVAQQMPWAMMTKGDGDSISLSSTSKMLATWAGYFSPANLNPLALNPLRNVLKRLVDFDELRKNCPFKLFIGATQVNTGKLRLFRETELSVDVLLASSCLPKIHHAMEIDGEHYWDGGYSANPAVYPLFYECEARDILLVLLSPLRHTDTPSTMDEIEDRATELGFNTHFLREMQGFARALEYTQEALPSWGRMERRLHSQRFHMIDSNNLESLQRRETKMLAHGPFLELLRDQGRERAAQWLADAGPMVGRRNTVDMTQWSA
jgi:NTE family protein